MPKELSEQQRNDIIALENAKRGIQMAQSQRSRFDMEVAQIDAAAEELGKTTGKVYKTIGGVLVESKSEDIKKELASRKSALQNHVENLKKEEKRFGDKATEINRRLEASMKGA